MTGATTRDAYLGGRLVLEQPAKGYRAGVDAVLLAASVPAVAGQSVLDLGCGAGAVALCLAARVAELDLTGVEVQPAYAQLARRNGQGSMQVFEADLRDLPDDVRQRQFDHVVANPPYYDRTASRPAPHAARETAHGETAPLDTWIRLAARRLAPKGMLHIIHRAERLPDIMGALPHDMGSIEVLPLAPRAGRMPERVILRARKSGRGAFKLYPPLILHAGSRHEADGDSYVPLVAAVLRDGAALDFDATLTVF